MIDYKSVLTTCPYCGTGCGFYLQVINNELAGVLPAKQHPVSQGGLCIKGWNADVFVAGTGTFGRPKSLPDPETGACSPLATLAWAAVQIEIEVDTETGAVVLIDSKSVYDVGKAINPELAKAQVEGGAVMGMSFAILENLIPNYPLPFGQPHTLGDYMIPTAMDIPNIETVMLECPSTEGPFGAKGIGEMTANPPSPAIVNALHDALGVWITDLPITPEKVLRALEGKESAQKHSLRNRDGAPETQGEAAAGQK